MDRVDLYSGNLHVEIPLVTLHGRAHDTTLKLIYNSIAWKTYIGRDSTYIEKCDLEAWQNPSLGWNLTSNPRGGRVTNLTYVPYNSGNHYELADFIENDGTKHTLAGILGVICNTCSHDTTFDSTDSTYIRLSVVNATYGVTGNNEIVYYKDGVKFRDADDSVLDTNGNYLDRDSLGRTFTSSPAQTRPTTAITYSASDGTTATIQMAYTNYAVNCSGDPINDGTLIQLLSSVTLPGGRTYQFQYGATHGELSKIILPSGGYIRYVYGGGRSYDAATSYGSVTARAISVDGSTEQSWSYGYSPVGTTPATTVTDPLGNTETHLFDPGVPQGQPTLGHESEADYKDSTGKLLLTTKTTYAYDSFFGAIFYGNVRPTSETTILDNGLQKRQSYTYGSYGNVATQQETDYGQGSPGPLLRKTSFAYLHDSNSAYATVRILDRLASKLVYSPSNLNTTLQQTLLDYDLTAPVSITGATAHDDADYPTTYATRGNLTRVRKWLNNSNAYLASSSTYDSLGNVLSKTDPAGSTTNFNYYDNFYNFTPTQPTYAFLTQTTLPTTGGVSHTERRQYFFNAGLLAAECGQNFPAGTACSFGNSTGSDYMSHTYDQLGRTVAALTGDGGSTTLSYNDTTLPLSATTTTTISASQNKATSVVYDGLSRVKQTQINSDPDGPTYAPVAYDAIGRAYLAYNPTRCTTPTTNCGESTWGYTTTLYDALGRVTSLTAQDGQVTTTTYSGNCSTTTDPAGKARKSCSDGLGRLTAEYEDPSGLNYLTTYTYDALNNLTSVVQNGSRQRTFVYDSLSRLASATNPESGTASYTYDADGNLTSKTSPAPNQTGTATVTLSYCYDTLNRLTSKAYTSQSCPMASPVATYLYDQTSSNGLTITNGVGRRTGMTDQAGAEAWSYDSMGRVLFEKRTTNSVSKTIPYTYNLDGSLASVATPTFPDGSHPWTFNYTPGGAGRPLALNTLIINAKYTPAGQLCNSLGQYNGNWTSVRSFNNRLQPTFLYTIRQTAGSPPAPPPCAVSAVLTNSQFQNNALALTYSYNDANNHNNGNVQSVTNNLASWRSQSFSYDSLNRLTSAQSTGTHATNPTDCWAESYT